MHHPRIVAFMTAEEPGTLFRNERVHVVLRFASFVEKPSPSIRAKSDEKISKIARSTRPRSCTRQIVTQTYD